MRCTCWTMALWALPAHRLIEHPKGGGTGPRWTWTCGNQPQLVQLSENWWPISNWKANLISWLAKKQEKWPSHICWWPISIFVTTGLGLRYSYQAASKDGDNPELWVANEGLEVWTISWKYHITFHPIGVVFSKIRCCFVFSPDGSSILNIYIYICIYHIYRPTYHKHPHISKMTELHSSGTVGL